MPGAEFAEQEGAGNTETEQAAAEEGDERVPLYELKILHSKFHGNCLMQK